MKVSEIFRSLQGEGRQQGRPCTFVRCAGCNLSCRWCDTAYARGTGPDMPVQEIIDRVHALGSSYVCITGGEPLLQEREVVTLAGHLHDEGARVEIETNGTRDFSSLQPFAAICMDVKCPSSGEKSNLSLLSLLTSEDSVKFVVEGGDDCRYVSDVLSSHQIECEIFVSPVHGSNYRFTADYVLEHNLPVHFQLQLHRILGVR